MNNKVSIIVAIDEKRGIGKNNDLLFKIPEDFKRLKTITNGHPIIMGKKTFDSIGRVLPNRTNIIVTRNPEFQFEGAVVAHSLEEGIEVGKKVEQKRLSSPTTIGDPEPILDSRLRGNDKIGEVFIFGGGQLFRESIEKGLVDRIYLTVVKGDYGADTFFPDYSAFSKIIEKEEREADGYQYTFLTIEK